MSRRTPITDARCAQYVQMLERGQTLAEVAASFGLCRNAVHAALLARGLPTSMKAAVQAYWQRQDAAAAAHAAAKKG